MARLFSSESVTQGHPDKVADSISDAVLDAVLAQDSNARVACEVALGSGFALLFGEITTTAKVNYEEIARSTIKSIGYNDKNKGYSGDDIKVIIKINTQSPDIALGVDETNGKEQGAGDQGFVFGYANDETHVYMPLPIYLSHRLAERLAFVRKENIIPGLGPDGKTQVTVAYDDNDKPTDIHTVVLSTQHDENIQLDWLKEQVQEHIIQPILKDYPTENTIYQINPTGRFVVGGPEGDAGLTGRKIIVDTYGGYARHGGGAFSGKDPSKVDRSAAYMARYIAKNIVASGIATACEIQIAYAIGVAKPVSVYINTFGTAKVDPKRIETAVHQNFDLTPKGIIQTLDLKKPIYKQTSAYGHFGKLETQLPWERLDKIAIFQDLV